MLPVSRPVSPADRSAVLNLTKLSPDQLRKGSDGWYAVMQLGGITHRLWLREAPAAEVPYAVALPFDANFDIRARAAERLWRALNNRPVGPVMDRLSPQGRARLILALRALDASQQGNSYRTIAEVLFGSAPISEGAWKTHPFRSRTIRLVKSGFALMRGGYLDLLRHGRKHE